MRITSGEVFDGKFQIIDLCSDCGGMGTILHVKDLTGSITDPIVLKYCKNVDDESLKRFKREVRMLSDLAENTKVVRIYESNIDHEPPYFVMKYYKDGDLLSMIDELKDNYPLQEAVVYKMLDCISELHKHDIFHRDIKPQNFLRDGELIVVSDFGLGKIEDSSTRFTSTTVAWGTQGFLPPEFTDGGFKKADASCDIFMLGKSIYLLLSGQNPIYLMSSCLPSPIFNVIEKACSLNKVNRYQTIDEFKQAVKLAYDVMLSRSGVEGEIYQIAEHISYKLKNENKFDAAEVKGFLEKLGLVDESIQEKICRDIDPKFFLLFNYDALVPHVSSFLAIYRKMVESTNYGFSFAETIAENMKRLFSLPKIGIENRVNALNIALEASYLMNRFAAMSTCTSIISEIDDDELGMQIAGLIQRLKYEFLKGIEISGCKNTHIIDAVLSIKRIE